MQQREGRIVRQGNENEEVDIFSYVTEGTFDAYLYQLVENKQKFIGQVMTSKSPVRSADDIDEQSLSYAEIKALASGNPLIKEKMDLDVEIAKLKLLKSNHLNQKYMLEDKIVKEFPKKIKLTEEYINGYVADIAQADTHTNIDENGFCSVVIGGKTYHDKKEAGEALLKMCESMKSPEPLEIGEYRGFLLELSFDTFSKEFVITLKNVLSHHVRLGNDIYGNFIRMDNAINSFSEKHDAFVSQLKNIKEQLELAKTEVTKPFSHEEELKEKNARLVELNSILNIEKRENEIDDCEEKDNEEKQQFKEQVI